MNTFLRSIAGFVPEMWRTRKIIERARVCKRLQVIDIEGLRRDGTGFQESANRGTQNCKITNYLSSCPVPATVLAMPSALDTVLYIFNPSQHRFSYTPSPSAGPGCHRVI